MWRNHCSAYPLSAADVHCDPAAEGFVGAANPGKLEGMLLQCCLAQLQLLSLLVLLGILQAGACLKASLEDSLAAFHVICWEMTGCAADHCCSI